MDLLASFLSWHGFLSARFGDAQLAEARRSSSFPDWLLLIKTKSERLPTSFDSGTVPLIEGSSFAPADRLGDDGLTTGMVFKNLLEPAAAFIISGCTPPTLATKSISDDNRRKLVLVMEWKGGA